MGSAAPHDVAALYRSHAAGLARFLAKRGVPPQDVADLVQEVFLVVHRQGGYHAGAAQPFTWLAAIAVRVASAEARRRRRRIQATEGWRCGASGGSPMSAAELRETIGDLDTALARLSARDRALLIRCAIAERCRAVAAELGVSVGAVYVRLHVARRRLARALLEHAGPRPGGAPARRPAPGRGADG